MGFVLGQFPWLILELIVLGLIVWQIVSVTRSIRRDREAARKMDDKEPPSSG